MALILSLSRVVMLALVADSTTLANLLPELFQGLFVGMRFDLRVATIGFAPLLLAGLVMAATPWYKGFTRIIPGYSFILYWLGIALSISNYFYFKTYGNHFDMFVFGLVEDDTASILLSMWADYPIVSMTLLSIASALVLNLVTLKATQHAHLWQWPKRHTLITTASVVVTILGYALLARGSMGTFPLKQYHANVSTYEALNKMVPNALMALDWANSQHKKDAKFKAVKASTYHEQMNRVLAQSDALYQTPENTYLAQNRPNVVFALMEGMGSNILREDSLPDNDLLGSLRSSWKSDFVFQRFVSAGDGTISSIVSTLFHSNINSISHSSAQRVPLLNSAFRPFKQAHYKTVYITGGSPNWRNLRYYLPQQGVDEFYDENDIKQRFSDAAALANTWGVPDEYAFKFAQLVIAESKQPVMIMIQTQTNHPPYQVPSNYQPQPLAASEHLLSKMTLADSEVPKMLATYQYAANSLGDFIQSVKASTETTIVAASGDHRLRNYAIDYPADLGFTYAVPLYLYVPPSILSHVDSRYEKQRVGSHRDIFPTLYALSLSQASYYSLGGRNLLAPNDVANPMGVNPSVTLTSQGVISNAHKELLYPWQDDHSLEVVTQPQPSNQQPQLEAYQRLNTLFIHAQVAGIEP